MSLALEAGPTAPVTHRYPIVRFGLIALERSIALVAVILLLPVLLVVAAAIYLDNPGPVLFRQVRVGQYGRFFSILKFRTMRLGAEAELAALVMAEGGDMGAYVKLERDPRITRLGAILRRTSIDELPQLWNVVRGDMSLVGPRPQTPAETETYAVGHWRRLLVRPGITGLWQVSGRSDLSADEALALDVGYVRRWSPGLDVRLLFRTVAVVLTGRGAR
ncbi:sugar transferase [Nocardioides sp.]|uniref:sugar transferase n=1 Tax=Nocardioides sp. TaxID=35761 RepID=UPI003568A8B9